MHVCNTSKNVIHLFQVKKHKTGRKGPAPLMLKALVKNWLWQLVNIVVSKGIQTDLVFCTSTGGRVKNLGKSMMEQWTLAGLSAKVNFNLMRSSATSKVRLTKQTLSADKF